VIVVALTDAQCDAILGLLADLRDRIADDLRYNLEVLEIGRYEPCADVDGTRREAASMARATPLLAMEEQCQ